MVIALNNNAQTRHCQYAFAFDDFNTLAYAKTMNKLRENLLSEMDKRGWNAYDLSEKSGVPQSTIQRFLSGKHEDLRGYNVIKLAKGLGISESKLRGLEDSQINEVIIVNSEKFKHLQEPNAKYIDVIKGLVPLISWVQAGAWGEAIDDFISGNIETWLPCPEKHSKHSYALKVIGDSMTSPYLGGNSYPEGTLIYVDPERELMNGSKVIAKILNKNEVTFKVYREDAGKKWLMPLNPAYEKIEFVEGMNICGVVIFSGRAE